jgi:hypothetical protein
MKRDTGFHPLDSDWTAGRATAISEANYMARIQINFEQNLKRISLLDDSTKSLAIDCKPTL